MRRFVRWSNTEGTSRRCQGPVSENQCPGNEDLYVGTDKKGTSDPPAPSSMEATASPANGTGNWKVWRGRSML